MLVMVKENLTRLERHISEGRLELLHIVGVPRSHSTALGRALNHSSLPSAFINEPFNRTNDDPNIAAGHILEIAEPLMGVSHRPVVTITKNMASYLSPAAHREMASLASSTIYTVRHPLIQMGSLVTRLANDIEHRHGADEITQDALTPAMLERVSALLQHSPRSKNFSKTGWNRIGRYWRSGYAERPTVIDGGELVTKPHAVLTGLCQRIGLPYHSQMVNGWQRDFTNVINLHNPEATAQSAWTNHVTRSIGIIAITRAELDLSSLPEPLQQHIRQVALPTYQEMMLFRERREAE